MTEIKLFQLLKTFNKKEFKEFEKIIISPYFSTGRDLHPLYLYLKKFHPDYNSDKAVKGMVPEVIFKHLFPRQQWRGKKSINSIDKLFSDTLKSAKEYLFQKSIREDFPQEKYMLLSLVLDGKHLVKESIHAVEISDKLWDKYGIDCEFFRGKINNEAAKLSVYLNNDMQIKGAQKVFSVADYTVAFFVSRVSKCLKNMIANEAAFNISYQDVNAFRFIRLLDIDSMISLYNEKIDNYSEIILMYLYELKAFMVNSDVKLFYEFKKLFYKNYNKLSFSERNNLFSSLNVCAKRLITINYHKYTHEMFEINKFRILKAAYKHSEWLNFTVLSFRSIFFTALNAEDIIWAKNFLRKYIDEVNPEHRESLKNICEASLLVLEHKYEKAVNKLNKVMDDLLFIFDKRVLTLICYHELGYFENALSLLDASNHFLRNNKNVSESYNVYYKKFFEIFGKILKMTISGDYGNSSVLKNYAIANLPVPFSTWIIKKLELYMI